MPRPANGQLQQLEAAIVAARSHLATLQGKHAHNTLAIDIQKRTIAQYEQRIAELKSEDTWLT
jgi:hypothetical protein